MEHAAEATTFASGAEMFECLQRDFPFLLDAMSRPLKAALFPPAEVYRHVHRDAGKLTDRQKQALGCLVKARVTPASAAKVTVWLPEKGTWQPMNHYAPSQYGDLVRVMRQIRPYMTLMARG